MLVAAEARFKGHAREEIDNFFRRQREQKARSQTVAQRSNAEFNAQVERIISSATEQSSAASDGQSKRARTRGIRDNRHLERELDRPNQILAPSLPVTEPEHAGAPHADNREAADIGASGTQPSMLEKLRKQRDQSWNENEN
jgi:Asp-tRNA(Asn)/Glu-tRNA(Gln) amidotransferase A subunit family amidase